MKPNSILPFVVTAMALCLKVAVAFVTPIHSIVLPSNARRIMMRRNSSPVKKTLATLSFRPFMTKQRSRENQIFLSSSNNDERNNSYDDGIFYLDILKDAQVINPSTGKKCNALDGLIISESADSLNPGWLQNIFRNSSSNPSRKSLVVVMPQLGDFDSAEYAEMLSAVETDLINSNIDLRIIAIGDQGSAEKFSRFNNLNLNNIRIDPEGRVHKALDLHAGPDWEIPTFIPDGILEWFADYVGAKRGNNDNFDRDVKAIARAWVNYMAMCAGIAAPDTLPEIFRGYVGDKNAPERIRPDETVTVGGGRDNGDKSDPLIAITGVSDVKLGPFRYQQLWKDEVGYQRPVELATVRLRVMVEVLTNFGQYVPDQRFLDLRGATFLFDENKKLLYKHIDTGVLSYSKTMARPLAFLEPFIGKKALNPLGLGDNMIFRL